MVFKKLFDSVTDSNSGEPDAWQALAEEMGLSYRPAKGSQSAKMRGEIDGHLVKVDLRQNRPFEIEGKFRSGSIPLNVRQRREGTYIDKRRVVPTGDQAFDARFSVLSDDERQDSMVLPYLTPTRRAVLIAVGDALEIDEVDSNELEVKLSNEAEPAQLREAIELVAMAVKALDESGTPQDAVRTSADRAEYPQDEVRE